MIRFFTFLPVLVLGSLLLASCATIEEQQESGEVVSTPPAGWNKQQQQRKQIQLWELRGRLGVQTETEGGTMDIIWKQSGDEFSIRLIAPLAAGTYLVQGDNTLAEIRYPDGKKRIIDNIDGVFAATLDVDLPVSAVKDWIRGLPASALPVEQISWNSRGLLHTIKQGGWNVELKKYTGTKILLPHALYLTRDDNEELDIRLILRQWLIDN